MQHTVRYRHRRGRTMPRCVARACDVPGGIESLKHHRHLIYGDSIQNLRQALEKDLDWLKSEIANRQSVLTVRLNRTYALLEKKENSAHAKIDLMFDLNNDTTVPSSEIEAIYFDTGREWTFTQDGQECASRQIEGGKNFVSHFIRSPVRRLQAKSWAEIKISGDKLLDHKYGSKNKDKEFKDKYKIAGRAKVRVLTTEGAFNFPIDLDIEVDEFPF